MLRYTTSSSEETHQLGFDYGQGLQGGEVLGLVGELGSGKTTFIQGLAKGLGIAENIISPTFILMRHYSKDQINLYHLDFYRINTIAELENLGLTDLWLKPKNITVIEWAEKAQDYLPKQTNYIEFKYLSETDREITFLE